MRSKLDGITGAIARNSKSRSLPETRDRVWQDYVILFADILKSAVTQYADPTPYTPSSPSANFEEVPDNQHNGDMHYWQVWHAQAPASDYTLQFPRFMTEYGFQSFPEMRTIRRRLPTARGLRHSFHRHAGASEEQGRK